MSSTALTLPTAARALPSTTSAAVRTAALALAAAPPVAQLTTSELGNELVSLLPGLAFLLGHTQQFNNPDDIDAMADGVAELIHRRFARLNLVEIGQALRRGASGEWPLKNELLRVNLPCITHWLVCYCQQARSEAQLALQQLPAPAPAPPHVDYLGSLLDFVALAKAGELPAGFELDTGNMLYTWLKGLGALNGFRTAPQYAAMQAEETERLLATSVPGTGPERREYTTFVNALAKASELPDAHPLSRSVLNACKKRVLREWLHQHAAAGTDMLALLSPFLSPYPRNTYG